VMLSSASRCSNRCISTIYSRPQSHVRSFTGKHTTIKPRHHRSYSTINQDADSSQSTSARRHIFEETCDVTNSKRVFHLDAQSKNAERKWVLEESKKVGEPLMKRLSVSFASCFLPENYPRSVGVGYKGYFLWLALQSICGSASYVLSTKALLSSVGLSAAPATSAAAAIAWVLKDGVGSLGVMLFASKSGSKFDDDAKRNRWKGDTLHNTGVLIELAIPIFPKTFLVTASIANVLKGISGLASGATRASIHKNFSLRNNLGDITAKSQTQGIGCYLVGMALGIGLSQIPANYPGSPFTFLTFGVLASCHLFSSYRALSHVQFSSLNLQRASQNIEMFMSTGEVMDLASCNQGERIIRTPEYKKKIPIVIGQRVDLRSHSNETEHLFETFMEQPYLLLPAKNRIDVVLRKGFTPLQLLRAYFNAYILQHIAVDGEVVEQTKVRESYIYTETRFGEFLKKLQEKGWDMEYVAITPGSFTADWSIRG